MPLPPNREPRVRTPRIPGAGAGLFADFNIHNVSNGLISATLICTGPAIVLLEAAANIHFAPRQAIGWMFAVYVLGGLFGVIMSLRHRKPIVGGHSLTAVAFLSTIAAQVSHSQLIGGFVLSGFLIFMVGVLGIFTKIMRWVPREVISAMMAGMVAGYVVRLIFAVKELPVVGGIAIMAYLLCLKFARRFPPALAAVAAAILAALATQKPEFAETDLPFLLPRLQMPEFSLAGLISVALPVALLVLSNDIAPGIGVLKNEGYDPPVRRLVSMSGIFSMLAGFLGGQSANIAGMASAICTGPDSGPRQSRYAAAVVSGVLTLAFGVMAWKIVPFVQALPAALFSMLAGFALLGVLVSNLKESFSADRHAMSALTAFAIALSNVSVFQISAPVWAILCGTAVHWFMKIRIGGGKG